MYCEASEEPEIASRQLLKNVVTRIFCVVVLV
jgi:hypothetical protein